MTILEFKKHIPDLFERVEKALEEPKEYKLKGMSFHNGLFIKQSGELYGILGYDSTVRLRLKYFPPENFSLDKHENIKIKLNSDTQILDSNHKLEKRDGSLLGRVKFSEYKPLILETVITNNLPNKYFHFVNNPLIRAYEKLSEVPKEAVKIVKSLGLKDKRTLNNNERAHFKFEEMLPLLEWLKINMNYKKKKTFLKDVVKDREGVCEDFSDLFVGLVHIAGGQAYSIGTYTLNLPLKEWNYFSLYQEPIGRHALTKVYYNNAWHVVDPTIYNTTYHNPKIPEGLEKRAYSPEVRNYHIIKISPARLIFLDREIEIGPAKDELTKMILRQRKKFAGTYHSVYPIVDKESIEILK